MNKYEFKMEDIKEIKIVTKEDPQRYTIKYKRVYYNNTPTETFIATFHSLPIEKENDRKIGIMCDKCGKITRFKRDYYHSDRFKFICSKCKGDNITCDEEYVREYTLSLMEPETFSGIDLFINNIHII